MERARARGIGPRKVAGGLPSPVPQCCVEGLCGGNLAPGCSSTGTVPRGRGVQAPGRGTARQPRPGESCRLRGCSLTARGPVFSIFYEQRAWSPATPGHRLRPRAPLVLQPNGSRAARPPPGELPTCQNPELRAQRGLRSSSARTRMRRGSQSPTEPPRPRPPSALSPVPSAVKPLRSPFTGGRHADTPSAL